MNPMQYTAGASSRCCFCCHHRRHCRHRHSGRPPDSGHSHVPLTAIRVAEERRALPPHTSRFTSTSDIMMWPRATDPPICTIFGKYAKPTELTHFCPKYSPVHNWSEGSLRARLIHYKKWTSTAKTQGYSKMELWGKRWIPIPQPNYTGIPLIGVMRVATRANGPPPRLHLDAPLRIRRGT